MPEPPGKSRPGKEAGQHAAAEAPAPGAKKAATPGTTSAPAGAASDADVFSVQSEVPADAAQASRGADAPPPTAGASRPAAGDQPWDAARQERERLRLAFSRAIGLLQQLVDTPSPLLITNDSLRILLSTLQQRFDQQVAAGQEGQQLLVWEAALPGARAQLVRLARENAVTVQETDAEGLVSTRQVLRANEQTTTGLLSFCPPAPKWGP